MKAKLKAEGQFVPGGKVLNKSATGAERAKLLKSLKEVSERAGKVTRKMGLLTDEDVARFINEP